MAQGFCHPERTREGSSLDRLCQILATTRCAGSHVPLRMTGAVLLLLLIASSAKAVEKIRIEIPVFAGGEGMDFFIECAREYEKVNPNVIVDLYGDSRIDDKVRVRVLEGTFFEITNAIG